VESVQPTAPGPGVYRGAREPAGTELGHRDHTVLGVGHLGDSLIHRAESGRAQPPAVERHNFRDHVSGFLGHPISLAASR
jgi:hypothetical protein